MKYVASVSFGKDSLAMLLRLIEENRPIDYAVFFDTEMEYKSIYVNMEKCRKILSDYGAELVVLKPKNNWLFDMLLRPVNFGKESEHYGYEWCGKNCRWRTTDKTIAVKKFLKSLNDEYVQYIGIAADESDRIKNGDGKTYPLVEWNMTEKDCLAYCYEKGFDWNEDGVELYSVLDRVSCWCCRNKNKKELYGMYKSLPYYWSLLKGLQSRIDRPFKDKSVFELEKEFKLRDLNSLF